jgi:primosomal protein N' (replication factor Y)
VENPVARVALDVPLAHLDRPFDYFVPESMSADAVPGCRVRVRFAGRLVDGFILERQAASDHHGSLAPLARVVSAEPVLAPEIAHLARLVAERYAGTTADVLRLAVPPRHARTEREVAIAPARPAAAMTPVASREAWQWYSAGPAFLAALTRGESPRAVWAALPGPDHWAAALAAAVHATVASGRGALVVVPDKHDVGRLEAAVTDRLGLGRHLGLISELGPAERYRRFLAVRRGQVSVVIGTRAAAFAPVARLGLVTCWDDGDDLHEEPRAPYPHTREILTLRAHEVGAAALVGGFAVTADGARLVATGWAHPIRASRATTREHAPRVVVGEDSDTRSADGSEAARAARLPTSAWSAAKDGLTRGPVLVQVPRGGYAPALACARCRTPARCSRCSGPLSVTSGHAIAVCRWCGASAGDWSCPECGHGRFRARVVGAVRTAEELGRAYPSVPIVSSSAQRRRKVVSARPALVVATPGAEPVAPGGYAAALLLDGWALLDRADLRAGEEALRRWLTAAALVRADGTVVVVADRSARPVQALLRWDPFWHAERELADRTALGFPPASRIAAVEGTADAVADLLTVVRLPPEAKVIGPTPIDDQRERVLIRVRPAQGVSLAVALKQAQGVRSARKAADPVRVDIDPHPLR